MQAINMQPEERRIIILDEIPGQDESDASTSTKGRQTTKKTTPLNADEHVNVLLENNRNWAHTMNEGDPDFFKKLGDSPPCC